MSLVCNIESTTTTLKGIVPDFLDSKFPKNTVAPTLPADTGLWTLDNFIQFRNKPNKTKDEIILYRGIVSVLQQCLEFFECLEGTSYWILPTPPKKSTFSPLIAKVKDVINKS